jgi:hypothetical protein
LASIKLKRANRPYSPLSPAKAASLFQTGRIHNGFRQIRSLGSIVSKGSRTGIDVEKSYG